MPLSTTVKAALCLCPPAMMAGAVVTVPTVKRAVHHLTAPRHPVAHHGSRPAISPAAAGVNCDPVAPAALPALPLVTYAAPIPAEPGGATPGDPGAGGGLGGPVAALAAGAPATVAPLVSSPAPTPTTGPTTGSVGAVPEPATWLTLIGGAGIAGAALRRRRRAGTRSKGDGVRAAAGAVLWSGGAAAEVGDAAATVAIQSTVAAKSTVAGLAGKAMMCVCPAMAVAGGVLAVPPLRQAVHASTAPPIAAGIVRTPCPAATTIPVSATPLAGFPASVATTPTVSRS